MSAMGNLYGFLGYYNHSRRKLEKAKSLYEKAMKRGMERPSYLLSYGVLMLMEGEFERARELFSKVLVELPAGKDYKRTAKMNLALAYWKLGDIDTAVEMMEEVHRVQRNGKVYGTLGYLFIEKGDLERALEYNMEALDYDDRDPVVLDNLGQIYYRMGKLKEAKEYFSKAEEEKGDQAVTLYNLGLIYSEEGNRELAEDKLKKALTCDLTPLSAVTREAIEEKLRELQ